MKSSKNNSRLSRKPTISTSNKEREIWEDKYQKAFAVISVTVNEDVSFHIASISDSYGALKKFNDLYDTHSQLKLIQLMLKIFNLELKNDDLWLK